jgi:hypothetical protein
MKILGWIVGVVVGLFLFVALLGSCTSPSQRAAYDKADRINEACDKMMADAALGAERRNVRQACDNMKQK